MRGACRATTIGFSRAFVRLHPVCAYRGATVGSEVSIDVGELGVGRGYRW